MERHYNLVDAIKTLLRWKWKIVGVGLITGILSVVVTLMMPDIYESTAVLYPINQSITERSALFSSTGKAKIEFYGSKRDANRMIAIANSAPMIDFMINHFGLMEHYKIKKNEKYARFKTQKKFKKNYNVIKTERDAIEISIMDEDPQLAADMVNLLIQKLDENNKTPVINNKVRIAETFKKQVDRKTAEFDSLTTQLVDLGKKYNINVRVNSGGVSEISGSNSGGVELYKVLQSRHNNAQEELIKLQNLYDQYDLSRSENVPSIYVVQEAFPGDRKVKPVRSVICLSMVLISVFLAILSILAYEQYKAIDQSLDNA